MGTINRKVCINVKSLAGDITGIERYLMEVLGHVDGLLPGSGICVEAVYPMGAVPKLPELQYVTRKELPSSARRGGYLPALSRYLQDEDALYVNMSGGIALNGGITVIHDIRPAAFKNFDPFRDRLRFRASVRYAKQNAARIVTPSEFSKRELSRFFGISLDKIEVISDAWQHYDRVKSDETVFTRNPAIKQGAYYYALGSRAPHKNLKWVQKVARRNPGALFVVAGKKWRDGDDDAPNEGNVLFLGYVTDEESKALMMHCRAFLHPALYEGFGLTPLEAASCGAPIVVSNAGSLPEVFGDYAAYIDPHDYDVDLDALVSAHFSDSTLSGRRSYDYSGLLGRYSWEASAGQWLELMADCTREGGC